MMKNRHRIKFILFYLIAQNFHHSKITFAHIHSVMMAKTFILLLDKKSHEFHFFEVNGKSLNSKMTAKTSATL